MCSWLRFSAEIGGGDPEHLAFGVFAVEPEQRPLWKGGLQPVPSAPDLAQQSTLRCQVYARVVQDASDDVEAIGAAVERKLRLGAAFPRQRRHALGIHVGRIGDDQVVTRLSERGEQIAMMERNSVLKVVFADIARGYVERIF